jgi:hypothetical protein
MPFEILRADGEGAQRWRALVEGLPAELKDIHLLPEYGRIYRDSYGFEPLLALYREGAGYVLQTFVKRPLATLPFLLGQDDANRFADLANPYGYGGPFSNGRDAVETKMLYRKFTAALAMWCEAEGVASEFASLHPFAVEHQRGMIGGTVECNYVKDVVYIDLDGDAETVLRGLNRGHRSSVAKARRLGVLVEKVATDDVNIKTFADIYYATMRRRNAAERWFVPAGHFSNTVKHLGPERCSLFFATINGAVEAAYLLMHGFSTAYYHFAGMRDAVPEARANNILMYETAIWAQRHGYKRYHLGGGVTSDPNDTLLRFKAGFSTARAPLYTYFRVCNNEVYDELCERKRAHERAVDGRECSSGFLPLYRR